MRKGPVTGTINVSAEKTFQNTPDKFITLGTCNNYYNANQRRLNCTKQNVLRVKINQ